MTNSKPFLVLCAAAVAVLVSVVPARADVIEVGGDGAVRIRDGAGPVVWQGADETTDAAPDVPADAVTLVGAAPAPGGYAPSLAAAAGRAGVSPRLLAALVWRESGWRAGAVSPKGAVGIAQLMPATARSLGIDARDPVASLEGGARYLRAQIDRFGGNVEQALAAYNAGPGRVLAAGGVPAIAETRAYVAAILDRLGTDGAATGLPRAAPIVSGILVP